MTILAQNEPTREERRATCRDRAMIGFALLFALVGFILGYSAGVLS